MLCKPYLLQQCTASLNLPNGSEHKISAIYYKFGAPGFARKPFVLQYGERSFFLQHLQDIDCQIHWARRFSSHSRPAEANIHNYNTDSVQSKDILLPQIKKVLCFLFYKNIFGICTLSATTPDFTYTGIYIENSLWASVLEYNTQSILL